MKILLIGGTGLIGKSVAKYLETSNELIAAGIQMAM